MLIRHRANGVLVEVDDEYGETLIASGHFAKTRKRTKTEPQAPTDEDLLAWLEAEEAFLNSQGA